MSLTTDVTFRRTDTSFTESNTTLTCKRFDTQASVDTTGWTLTHIQNGIYELVVPNATVKSIYSLVDNSTGLITADGVLDVDLGSDIAAILADTDELQGDWTNGGRLDTILDSAAADAATAAAGGVDPSVLAAAMITAMETAGVATDAELQELEDKIDLALSTGTSISPTGGAGIVSSRLISDLFDTLRPVLRDDQAKVYKDNVLVPFYNRAVEEVNSALIQLSAEIAMDKVTITGDGVNYTFELPANFLAFVPSQVRPRSPSTAANNYTMGAALTQADQFSNRMTQIPTTIAAPDTFILIVSGTGQYIRFNSIPISGEIIDALYYYKPVAATVDNIFTEHTPWLGLLDSLILRMLEHYCREGLEFTHETRALWIARTMADAAMLLGLRHLQTSIINPSSWYKVPRR